MSPAQKVFMIGWEYPPHNSGGLGVACEGMTQALADQNTQIYFTLPYKLDPVGHMQLLNCSDPTWFADGQMGVPPFLAYSSATDFQPARFSEKQLSVKSLEVLPQSEMEAKVDTYAKLVRDTGHTHAAQTDVIHAHDWMSFPAAIELSQKTGKPYVAHVHSTEFDRIPSGHGSSYIMRTEYEGVQQARRVIAVSYYTKQLLINKYQVDPAKIDVVYNGIPALKPSLHAATTFAPGRPVIVFMGRLTMQKGADYFLKLASSVLQRIPNALFLLAGSGDMYHELLFTTAKDKLSASVLFSGFVRDKQRAKLLDRADVFVMPSLSEPFGLVALEAAQRRTPVILSTNSGVREVMKSSIVVDFWDVQKMTDAIAMLVANPATAAAQVEAQLSEVAAASWENSATRLREVYRRAFTG